MSQTAQRTPLVLVAPLAVNMLIYDLFRNLVRYLRARTSCIWSTTSQQAHNHLNLSSYFADYLPAGAGRHTAANSN